MKTENRLKKLEQILKSKDRINNYIVWIDEGIMSITHNTQELFNGTIGEGDIFLKALQEKEPQSFFVRVNCPFGRAD